MKICGHIKVGLFLVLAALNIAPDAIAQSPAPGATITAVVKAGSVGNSFDIYVTNANSLTSLRSIGVNLPTGVRNITNIVAEPPFIAELPPNTTRSISVRFDVRPDVRDAGERETLVFEVISSDGLLDYPALTLQLGIETAKTALLIVPHVVGMKTEEAQKALGRQKLQSAVDRASRPTDPALYDVVVAQSIAAGSIVEAATRVTVTAFPRGLVTIPKVTGLPVAEATRLISGAGLKPEVSPLGNAPSADKADRVDRSEPAEGKPVEPDSVVSILAYGPYRPALPPSPTAQPPAGSNATPPPPSVTGAWGQPWRGEVKLVLLVADGEQMSVATAIAKYFAKQQQPQPKSDGGLLSIPGEIVGGAAGGAAEAVAQAVAAVMEMLNDGAPLSIVLVQEQGGFRLRIPGSSKLVDTMNATIGGFLPLFLPTGGSLLKANFSKSDPKQGEVAVTAEIAAAPDWKQLTIRISLKAILVNQGLGPRSLELALAGTAAPGLHEAAQYEADIIRRFAAAAAKYLIKGK